MDIHRRFTGDLVPRPCVEIIKDLFKRGWKVCQLKHHSARSRWTQAGGRDQSRLVAGSTRLGVLRQNPTLSDPMDPDFDMQRSSRLSISRWSSRTSSIS